MYNTEMVGQFVGLFAWIAKVLGVTPGGTPTGTGTAGAMEWEQLPEEELWKIKRLIETQERTTKTGNKPKKTKLIGLQYESMFNQRDIDTFELDAQYANSPCLLLFDGHFFADLATPERQHGLVFGSPLLHSADIESKEGKVPFVFNAEYNPVAVTVGSGGLSVPSATGYTAPSAITIDAGGYYRLIQV